MIIIMKITIVSYISLVNLYKMYCMQQYTCLEEFFSDVQLIVENCLTYNTPDTIFAKAAKVCAFNIARYCLYTRTCKKKKKDFLFTCIEVQIGKITCSLFVFSYLHKPMIDKTIEGQNCLKKVVSEHF